MTHELATSFHAKQRRATQETIMDAVERRLQDDGLDELTFSHIAQEAGVAERTVYRHFPTKDALLEAFWLRLQQRLGMDASIQSWSDYVATRPAAFAAMDRRERIMRAVLTSRQALEARLRLNAARQAGIRRIVAAEVRRLPEPELTDLSALVHVLGSAPTWQALKDYWGLEGEHAGRVVADAVATLVAAAKDRAGAHTRASRRTVR